MALHNDVFRQQIWEFFQDDLESCMMVSRIKLGGEGLGNLFRGGLNFTAATVIFTVIDFCAGFYHGKVEPTSTDIATFISKYLGKYYPPLEALSFSKQFYAVFRHGLIHQWSPKASGVAMNFGNENILVFDDRNVPFLNVPSLFKIVCLGLKDFESDLDTDPEMQKKFESRYEQMVNLDQAAVDKFHVLLSKYSLTGMSPGIGRNR